MNFNKNGRPIKQMGYGAMTLEGYYGESDDKTAIETLKYVIENNVMIDSADAYGNGHNEDLVKQAVKQANKEAFIATKFGIVFDENETGTTVDTGWGFPLKINGRPEYVRKCAEDSLRRLGVETIDLYYAHYIDPDVAIEETVGAMNDLIKEGKIQAIGLSNATVEEVKRASKAVKISAVQYEYSISRREVEQEMLSLVTDINAALVAWSPLANGMLTGTVMAITSDEFRNVNPKFQGDNFKANLQIIEQLKGIANDLNISTAQLALAWLINRGDHIIPIPGSRKIARVEDNLKALEVILSQDVMQKIDEIAPIGAFKGGTLV